MKIMGLDPGTDATGWAVLSEDYTVTGSGTFRPSRGLAGIHRRRWIMQEICQVCDTFEPAYVVYEDFVWRSDGDGGTVYRSGRPAMERLIGAIECLSLRPPYPRVDCALPQIWGKQLTGSTAHSKAQVARAVNLRLGTTFKGNNADEHQADATGVALWFLDEVRMEATYHQAECPRISPVLDGKA
jgi:Holliday junction resolvasome RuvABC endonuclease subunit